MNSRKSDWEELFKAHKIVQWQELKEQRSPSGIYERIKATR